MQYLARNETTRSEVVGEILFILTPDGFFLTLHPLFAQMTGKSETEYINRPLSSFLRPADLLRFRNSLDALKKGDTCTLSSMHFKTGKGTECDLTLSLVPRFRKGEMSDILCLGEKVAFPGPQWLNYESSPFPPDLTNLSNLIETFLANSPIAFSFFGEDLRYICVNKAFAAMSGFAPEQFLGRTVRELSPHLGFSLEPSIKRVLATERPEVNLEIQLPPSNSNYESTNVLASFYPVHGVAGRVVGVAAMLSDITERTRIHSLLREKEDRLRMAIEATSLGTWDWNILTGALNLSPKTKSMFGLPELREIDFEGFLSTLHPEDTERVKDKINKALTYPGEEFRLEYRVIGRDNVERWLSVQGQVYFDRTEHPVRFVGVASDITEQKRGEGTLRKLSTELARSNSELSSFASMTSHDLKEPLRTISNFVHLLEERNKEKFDPESVVYLNFVKNGTCRMKNLIEALLQYSRAGAAEPEKKMVDLNSILEEALQNLTAALKESSATLNWNTLPRVGGNALQLTQVFQNLISNSLKYRNKGIHTVIQVSSECKQNEWVISIKDNGIGFEMENAAKVFKPFSRLNAEPERSGSGLGLATCKQIIEKHHGRIWVESELGRGSTFFFSLPLQEV